MHDFRRLRVWHAANALTLAVYEATKSFPPDERFALTSQLRRAAVSIQANIAEGCGRGTRADQARMFQISVGSAAELASHLHLCHALGYLRDDQYQALDDSVRRIRGMVSRLLFRLKTHVPQNSP